MRLKPRQHIGSYEIESELGAGGMAMVYRAKHRVLHSTHAIKVLDDRLVRSEEARQRFLSEARIQAGLRHPHITPVTDVIAEPGVAAIVMPLLSGEDLSVRLERTGTVPVEEAVSWTLQILDALAFVHERGIVHRDLKPANLFLESLPGDRQVVRVMDFGIARVADSKLTRTAMTMGTLHYMSPEQIQSPRSVDPRSDLFSLGSVLYEMVVGQVTFDGDTDFQIQTNIVCGRYTASSTLLPGEHAALSAVIDRALSTSPVDRFDTAQAFTSALRQAAVSLQAPSPASQALKHDSEVKRQPTPPSRSALVAPDPPQSPSLPSSVSSLWTLSSTLGRKKADVERAARHALGEVPPWQQGLSRAQLKRVADAALASAGPQQDSTHHTSRPRASHPDAKRFSDVGSHLKLKWPQLRAATLKALGYLPAPDEQLSSKQLAAIANSARSASKRTAPPKTPSVVRRRERQDTGRPPERSQGDRRSSPAGSGLPIALKQIRRFKYVCLVCGAGFQTWKHARGHKVETGHGCLICSVCHKFFPSPKSAKEHTRTTRHTEFSGTWIGQHEMATKNILARK